MGACAHGNWHILVDRANARKRDKQSEVELARRKNGIAEEADRANVICAAKEKEV